MPSEAVNLEIVSRMPWLVAEPESIWEITGTYRNGRGTFTEALAMVLPYSITDGHRAFTLIHPGVRSDWRDPDHLIAPNQITHATRLLLVHADEPGTAYWQEDQDFITRGGFDA